MSRILSQEQIAEVCALERQGISRLAISQMLSIGLSTVYQVLKHPDAYRRRASNAHALTPTPAPVGEQAVGEISAEEAMFYCALGKVVLGGNVEAAVELVDQQLAAVHAENTALRAQLAQSGEMAGRMGELAQRQGEEIERLKREIETGGERWAEHWQWVMDNFKARDTHADMLAGALRPFATRVPPASLNGQSADDFQVATAGCDLGWFRAARDALAAHAKWKEG